MICYVAIHNDSGRRYVGITKGALSARKSSHISHAKKRSYESRFQDAIREYGEDAFSWGLLAEGPKRIIRLLEGILIYEWQTYDTAFGFNTQGGDEYHIRYLANKLEANQYMAFLAGAASLNMPPALNFSPDFREMDVSVAILDMMNDLDSIVRYCEENPLPVDRCSDLRKMCHRLLKRVDQLDPPV